MRSRQHRKGRYPGRARWRRKKLVTRMTRRTAMKGRQCPERRLMEPTRTQSETKTSPMGTRILIGATYRAVVVMRQTNGRSEEAMETRTESRLRRRRRRRHQRRKRYRRWYQRRRVAGSRTSFQCQHSVSPSRKKNRPTCQRREVPVWESFNGAIAAPNV